ncbi:osm1 [Symbiodinium sp. KB8]|nr:osm1 [Symbiodinium sp. KB8]
MSTFQNDIRVAGGSETPLAEVLGRNGLPDKSWLVDKFDLNLAMIAKHAGHSHPRTLRTGDGMPGMTITYALIQRVEKVAEVSDRARIITKAEVSRLLSRAGSVVGCEYQKFGRSSKEYGPVILCTGGFAAGVGPGSVLAKYRPDLVNLPTASAEHCTGDGLKLGEDVGAKTLDLEWVQLHPTGLIHLDEPEAPRKAIAGEIFRAAGALLLDACGERFCNELGPADHILEEMSKRPGRAPFWLCLNTAASRELQRQCRAFTRRRLMKCYASGKELAQEMRIPLQKLVEVHDAHAEAFRRTLRDAGESEAEKGANGTGPFQGPWRSFDGRRSYDEVSGKLGFGKCDFRNVLVGSRVADETFHAAQVTPVILYCAGGLGISVQGEVLKQDGSAIPGLFAAGECTGGVHGRLALPGNSLLDCLVFGRVAAKSACKYIFGEDDEFRPCPLPSQEGQVERFENQAFAVNVVSACSASAGREGPLAPAMRRSGSRRWLHLTSSALLSTSLAFWVLDDAVPRQSLAFLLGRGAGTSAGPRLAGCVSLQAWNDDSPPPPPPRPPLLDFVESRVLGHFTAFRLKFPAAPFPFHAAMFLSCPCTLLQEDDLRDESLRGADPTVEILDDTATNNLKRVSFKDDSSRPTSCTRTLPSDRGTSLSGSNSKKGVPLTTFVLEARKRKMLQARIKLLSFLGKNGFKTHDVNAKKSGVFGFSRTYPLHEAAKQDHASMVRLLLLFGADSAKKDSSGRTAYDYVKTKPPSDEVRRILEKDNMWQRQSAWHRIWPPQGFEEFLEEVRRQKEVEASGEEKTPSGRPLEFCLWVSETFEALSSWKLLPRCRLVEQAEPGKSETVAEKCREEREAVGARMAHGNNHRVFVDGIGLLEAFKAGTPANCPFRGVLTASSADKSMLQAQQASSLFLFSLRAGTVPAGPARGERKMTDVEKQADAIVHAVVAVELLHWHGKLGGTLENAFRKCVYVPVLPRLKRLTNRKDSADDFKIDMKTGRKLSRPSRVHDAALEKQFTLGFAFTGVALDALSRGDNGVWLPLARYQARRELNLADVDPGEDPQAKDLVAFSQGFVKSDAGQEMVQVTSRAVGHGDARQNIWILPVFVDHDRSSHAERQALLVLLQAAPIDPVSEGVKKGVTGQMRVFASHTPCISCLSSMCQFTRCFEGARISVTYDTWKETRRWIGLDPPDEIPSEEDEEEKAG